MVDGDREALDAGVADHLRLATQSRSPFHIANARTSEVTRAVIDGRWADAEAMASEILDAGRRLGDATIVNNFGIALFTMLRERGSLAAFESATRHAVEENPKIESWRAGYAHLLIEIGKREEARAELETLRAMGLASLPENVARPYAFSAAAEAAAAIGDESLAAELYDLLLASEGNGIVLGVSAYHGVADRHLGLLALTLGRADDAVRHLEAATAIHDRIGARPWAARSRYDLARALVARGGPGDAERSVALLNEVLDVANEIDLPRLTEEVLAVKLAIQGVSTASTLASIDAVAASVSIERPSLLAHRAADGRVSLLFSDIEGYSTLCERLGDVRTQELLRRHHAIVRGQVEAHKGTVVKSAGDGFMIVFAEVRPALRCALAVQSDIAVHDFGPDVGAVRVRMGLHIGEAIREEDDFYGRTVIVAARVAASASGGEILVTDAARDAVGDDVRFAEPREISLKGLSGTHRVHPVATGVGT
jgi:class 3 adenylate cyclase